MDSLNLGFLTLCTAYAEKIKITLMDKFVNILYQDSKPATAIIEDGDTNLLLTEAPKSIILMFNTTFTLVEAKGIKELMLMMLKVYKGITK
jgi:hypothetical protein